MKSYLLVVLLFVVGFASCKQQKDTTDEHIHDTKLQLTAYNEKIEVFAEADPFVLGKSSVITAHFTCLENFKPIEKATVTVSLIVGTKGIRQTLDQPYKKGIFRFQLQPEVVGSGKLVVDIQTESGNSQLIIPLIEVYNDEETAALKAEEMAVDDPGFITFTKEQSWKVEFATANPIEEPFGQVIKTTAQVQSAQGDEEIVSARANGIVLFSGNEVTEGNSVSSGQVLFNVSSAGLAENNATVRFAEAQSNFQRAKSEYERAQELSKEKIISEKEMIQIKSTYETAKAVYDNLYKNFSVNGQRVSSPMTGFVKQLFVSNGQFVEAGQPLISVSKNKTLLLKAELQQKYSPVLPYIVSANIRNRDNRETYTLEQLNGKMLSFGKSVNSDNFLIPVIFQIDNKGSFIPGSFIELFVKTRTNETALTVPNESLMEDQGAFFVFVQHTPEQFEKREVKAGATDGLKTEIKAGLSANERVVTRGAILVKLAQSSGALDPHAGHVH